MHNVFNRWSLFLIVSIFIFILSFMFFVNGFDSNEFIVPDFDSSAVYGLRPAVPDELNYTVLDDKSIPFSFGLCASPVISDDDLTIWFSNPKDNSSWLLLQVYSDDKLIGSSGVIKEGGFVEKVQCDFSNISNVRFRILAYEPFMYYSNGTVLVDAVIE